MMGETVTGFYDIFLPLQTTTDKLKCGTGEKGRTWKGFPFWADTAQLLRYVRSRNDNQMGGDTSATAGSSCEPERYVNGSANANLPNDGNINPCGLIAWSFFNDTYSLATSSGSAVPIDVMPSLGLHPCQLHLPPPPPPGPQSADIIMPLEMSIFLSALRPGLAQLQRCLQGRG